MKRFGWVVAMVALIAAAVLATPQVTGKDVIAMVKRSFDAINDYQADVSLSVKASRVSIKDMRMTVYYKKPDKVRVEAKQGFAVVPTGNFFGNPMEELAKHTRPVYLKCDTRNGRRCHVVRLDPNGSGGSPSVTIWVDTEKGVVLATRNGGRHELETNWTYQKVGGKYHLPSKIEADFEVPRGKEQTEKAKATIKFSNYRVNRGISDRVFEDKRGGK